MSPPDKAEEPSKEVESEATAAPAWPPKEAAPADEESKPSNGTHAAADAAGEAVPADAPAPPPAAADALAAVDAPAPAAVDAPAPPAPATEPPPVVVAPRDPAAPLPVGAALPEQEMGFSPSTLHWLSDGERPVEYSEPYRPSGAVPLPAYDPHAPVPGRRRALVVLGGASVIALAIAGGFFFSAESRRAAELPAAARVEPARDLTTRAQAAFAANRIAEALDLARLALVADGRFADAHFVVAECERARGQAAVARDQYRKYLELAPLGARAAEARAALATLPP